ncbi:MAG: acetaldehyde dehydrogenase (acetylating) [Dethiosulfovibrio peptidovorans]|nr:MAG: acetaldehyde dehydrogenase (acetylating) [Dethiosulfovibrio peptidovorans]
MVSLKDRDLLSIQETRILVAQAKKAQRQIAVMGQNEIDNLVRAAAQAGEDNAEHLAKMAHEETGFGRWEDKTLKNIFAARGTHRSTLGMSTVGIIREDREKKILEIASPLGIVAGLIPSTNPTSTTIFKAMIAVKAGNGIIFSPHPAAKQCIMETVRILSDAIQEAGGPEGLVGCLSLPTKDGTTELMRHRDISMILATGGAEMVHAAYSSGTPALGVGPGNSPAFIERTADIPTAVRRIIESKTFDYSTICASEQSVVVDEPIRSSVEAEFRKQGGYFLSPEEAAKVASVILSPSGTMNARTVGRSPQVIAELAGIYVPSEIRVLLAPQEGVGNDYPFSHEKLCPILAFYWADGWERCCERCIELLEFEGAGHSLAIHTADESIVREFGLRKPVSRLIVNAGSSLAAVGATTNLLPSLTLGCGAAGHNATSDNVGPMHLLNIRRVAWGIREIGDLRLEKRQSGESRTTDSRIDDLVKEIVDQLEVRLALK